MTSLLLEIGDHWKDAFEYDVVHRQSHSQSDHGTESRSAYVTLKNTDGTVVGSTEHMCCLYQATYSREAVRASWGPTCYYTCLKITDDLRFHAMGGAIGKIYADNQLIMQQPGSITARDSALLATVDGLWRFVKDSMMKSCDPSILYMFRKVKDAQKGPSHHRMMVAVFEKHVAVADVRLEWKTRDNPRSILVQRAEENTNHFVCHLDLFTETRDPQKLQHLMLEGPLASWYHPCCCPFRILPDGDCREDVQTCEEAADFIQHQVMWECCKHPVANLSDWDDTTLAFAMGKHSRLGKDSIIPDAFDDSILRRIFRHCKTESYPSRICTKDLLAWLYPNRS